VSPPSANVSPPAPHGSLSVARVSPLTARVSPPSPSGSLLSNSVSPHSPSWPSASARVSSSSTSVSPPVIVPPPVAHMCPASASVSTCVSLLSASVSLHDATVPPPSACVPIVSGYPPADSMCRITPPPPSGQLPSSSAQHAWGARMTPTHVTSTALAVTRAQDTPVIKILRNISIVIMFLLFGIGTTIICSSESHRHSQVTPTNMPPLNIFAYRSQIKPALPHIESNNIVDNVPISNLPRTIQTQSHIGSNNYMNAISSKPLPASGIYGLTMNGSALPVLAIHQIPVFEILYNNIASIAPIGIIDSFFYPLTHGISQDSFLIPKLITNSQLSANYLYDVLVNLLLFPGFLLFSGFFTTFFIMKGKPVFNLFLYLILIYLIKNYFSIHIFSNKLFIDSIPGTSLKNTTLPNPPAASKLYLNYNQNENTSDIWHLTELETLRTLSIFGTLTFVFSIFLYLNFKIYVNKCKNNLAKGKRKSKDKKKNMVISLLLITIFKFIIMVFVISASYNKINSDGHPQKNFKK